MISERFNESLERILDDLVISFDPLVKYEKKTNRKKNYRDFVRNK